MKSEQEVQDAVYARSGGKCECTASRCDHPTVTGGTRCTRPLLANAWHCHRVDRSGEHTVANCLGLCSPCHKATATYGKPLP